MRRSHTFIFIPIMTCLQLRLRHNYELTRHVLINHPHTPRLQSMFKSTKWGQAQIVNVLRNLTSDSAHMPNEISWSGLDGHLTRPLRP